MVAPVSAKGEYDVDLVYLDHVTPEETTKKTLKRNVGAALRGYILSGVEGAPVLHEGKRCFTLDYPSEPFHMDTLPAIPDPEQPPSGILLADKLLPRWQHSDPIAYAEWFHATMADDIRQLSEAIAKRMDVEDPPPSLMKTPLQRSVQALKRHRDLHFAAEPKHGPASIIITTLAGRAYRTGGSLHEALLDITSRMPALVERENGRYVISNPVADENFADRWSRDPDQAQRFFDWMATAQNDFSAIGEKLGIQNVLKEMGASLGEAPSERVRERLGLGMATARDAGKLGIGATGLLGATNNKPIPRHTFHGNARAPRR